MIEVYVMRVGTRPNMHDIHLYHWGERREHGGRETGVCGLRPRRRPARRPLLTCKFARKYPRRYYTFQRFLLPDWRDQTPSGYEMVQVDPQFLARQDLVNLDDVRERITAWTDFARDGFGFCLIHGNTIVSHCIADCVSGGACELGLATYAPTIIRAVRTRLRAWRVECHIT